MESILSNSISSDFETNTISSEDSPFFLSLNREEFPDEKELKKFIKNVEKIVRGSPEYRDWTEYIKDTLGHYSCELTGEISSQVTVDIHHHPISLFNVVNGVITKYINSHTSFSSYDISKDVMVLHFQNRIGYVPLARTLHEKFHNGFLQIPMEVVHGDWKYIVYNYQYDEDVLETIQVRISMTADKCKIDKDCYYWSKDNYKVEVA